VTRLLVIALAAALTVLAPASARTAHYGGTITIGTGAAPTGMDPTVSSDPGIRRILPQFCLPLYTYTTNHGTLALVSVLAKAPPVRSKDGLTLTIQLRQGIQFNDGTPFNAQAVVASYQRYITYPGSRHVNDFLGVSSAAAPGPYTVVYHLTQRNADFIGNLLPLSPTAIAKEGSGFFSEPICVGPFMVDSWTPNVQTTLVKSPYYYKRGAVYLDKIVFKTVLDIPTALADLQAGDVQVVQDSQVVPPTSANLTVIKAAQADWGGLEINIGNRNGVGNLPYSTVDRPLAQSPKLREAFEEAIDRNTVAKIAFNGIAEPSCTLIPPANTEWYAQTKVPCTPYAPKDAKRLVAASGVPLPITVHLMLPTGSAATLLEAQVVQSEENAVGFNVVLDVVGQAVYNANNASGSFDVSVDSGQPTDADPNAYIYNTLDTAGFGNDGGYSSPRMDYVLANALKATDPRARATDYRVAQQIMAADRPLIVLRQDVSYGVFDSDLKGVEFNPLGYLLFANAQYK
jgi:peptide/nickel transport system substrate-binding protein